MSHLALYSDDDPKEPRLETSDRQEIARILNGRGVRFELLELPDDALHAVDPAAALSALSGLVEALKGHFGYTTADVVRIRPDNPKAAEFRGKFLNEHTHSEDECRLMVDGSGCFYLHLDQDVLRVVVEGGDLITVPDRTKHWFDMGAKPSFTALRLFTNPEGWVGDFTGDAISDRFPRYEP